MTSRPLVEVALRLIGQGFLPGDVTAIIQIAPTSTWRLGDSVQNTQLKRKYDAWIFGLPKRETYDMDALLSELLDVVEPYKDRIGEAAGRFNLCKVFSFGVYLRGETPASCFAAETIRRVAAFGAGLDIDLIRLA